MLRFKFAFYCLLLSLLMVACGGKRIAVDGGVETAHELGTNSTLPFIIENQELAEALPPVPLFDGGDVQELEKPIFVLHEVPPAVVEPGWSLSYIDWNKQLTGQGYASSMEKLMGFVSLLDRVSQERGNVVPWQILYSMAKKETGLGANLKPNRRNRSESHGTWQINVKAHRNVKKWEAYDLETSSLWVTNHLIKLDFETDPFGALCEYVGGIKNKNKPAALRYAVGVLKDAINLGYQAEVDLGRLYEKRKVDHRHRRARAVRSAGMVFPRKRAA